MKSLIFTLDLLLILLIGYATIYWVAALNMGTFQINAWDAPTRVITMSGTILWFFFIMWAIGMGAKNKDGG